MKRSILVWTSLSCGLALSTMAHGDEGTVKVATAKRNNGQPGFGQPVLNMYDGQVIALKNAKSGLCIGVEKGHTNNGALLYQGTCNGAPDQDWRVDAAVNQITNHVLPGDYIYLRNIKNEKRCMGVDRAKVTPGANIGLYDCHRSNGVSNQKWSFAEPGRQGLSSIKNFKSSRAHPEVVGYCIGVDGAKTVRAQLKQFPCDGRTKQAWQVIPRG